MAEQHDGEVTTKMYNPNMKDEILAIPPRKDPGNVCCKWRFSYGS